MIALPAELVKRQPMIGRAHILKEALVIQSRGALSIADSYDDAEMSERCVISTDDVDYVGDVVVSTGGDWSGYSQAPSVFVDHKEGIEGRPVAFSWNINLPLDHPDRHKCTIEVEEHRILAKEYYTRATPDGTIFYHLSREGMRGKSIGFSPLSEPVRLPTGGFRYDHWVGLEYSNVGTGANKNAVTTGEKAFAEKLRIMLDKGVIAGESLSKVPHVKKFLMPLAAKAHPAFMFFSSTKAKPNIKFTAIPVAKARANPHTKSNSFTKAALASTSGTSGGYTVDKPEGVPADASAESGQDSTKKPLEELKGSIAETMGNIVGEETGHVVHVHPESGTLHHSHPAGYDAGKLGEIKEALGKIDGVKDVVQEEEKAVPPDGGGWEHAFGVDGKDVEPEKTKDPKPEEEGPVAEEKRLKKAKRLVKWMPHFALKLFLAGMKAKADSALEECVSHKIPKLIDEGYGQEQAEAIAFSMCGETKALDEAGGEEPYTIPGGMNPDEDTADEPHGVKHAKTAIMHHMKAMPAMHPNDGEFYKGIVGLVAEHVKSEYPEHAKGIDAIIGDGLNEKPKFDGSKPSDEEGADATEEALKPYKAWRPLMFKRVKSGIYKRLKAAYKSICKDAADHLGEMTGLKVGDKWSGAMKTATAMHHKAMCGMMKEMDAGNEGEAEGETADPGMEKRLPLTALVEGLANKLEERSKQKRYEVTGRREDKPNGVFTAAK